MSLQALQEQKAKRIKDKADEIVAYLVKNNYTSTRKETSSCAPAFGWSVEEYQDMPLVASELRNQGLTVSSQVNHGVTDWYISV